MLSCLFCLAQSTLLPVVDMGQPEMAFLLAVYDASVMTGGYSIQVSDVLGNVRLAERLL